MNKKGAGRPKLPEGRKQKHSRPAIYPDVYDKAKKLADNDGLYLTEWFKKIIEAEYDRTIFPKK